MTSAAPDLAPSPATTLPSSLRRIVLLGFMGAGKTTIGRQLAAALDWDFLDLDHHLEARAAVSIPEIFALHGEPHFRRLESSALASALRIPRAVLALGGGTPEELTNRLLLEQTPGTHILYLAAPFPVLYDRCMLQSFASPATQRPVLTTPAEAEARFNRRHPLYARLAHHTIATETLAPAAITEAIRLHLRTLCSRAEPDQPHNPDQPPTIMAAPALKPRPARIQPS